MHGELAQVGERRVAGAEVVDGQFAADVAQGVHALDGGAFVAHDRVFGQLEQQSGGRQAPGLAGLGHLGGKARVVGGLGREVDADAEVDALGLPHHLLAQHGVDDELGELADHAAVVADGGDHGGADLQRVVARPADQRLGGVTLVGGQVDLRLEMHFQIVAEEVTAQGGFDLGHARGVVIGADALHQQPFLALGGQLARIPGTLQQAANADGAAAAPGATDDGLQLGGEGLRVLQRDVDGHVQCFAEGGGHGGGDSFVGHVGDEDPDLVEGGGGHAVFGTQALADALDDLAQYQVGVRVARQGLQLVRAVQADGEQEGLARCLAAEQLLPVGQQFIGRQALIERCFHAGSGPHRGNNPAA